MVRKGYQPKTGLDCKTVTGKRAASEPMDTSLSDGGEKLNAHGRKTLGREPSEDEHLCGSSRTSSESVNGTNNAGIGKRNKKRSGDVPCTDKSDSRFPRLAQATEMLRNARDGLGNNSLFGASESRGNDRNFCSNHVNMNHSVSRGFSMETMAGHIQSSVAAADQNLRLLAVDVLNAAGGWLERQKPRVSTFRAYICNARDYILVQTRHVYPIIWTWILHVGKLIFLLSMVWLDCNIRGFSSLVRLGTTSFFAILWCSILSTIAMTGMAKVFIVMVIAALVAAFIGLALGIIVIAVFATVVLWLYGSFWTTALVLCIGGISFALNHERAALLVTALYSIYCARSHLGWLGLFLGLNLSFISSDILIYLLKNNINEHKTGYPPKQDAQTEVRDEYSNSSPSQNDFASRRSGVPSTSGQETDLTSGDEVVRLLNCGDHYSALGFARFENIDASLLKREYRKKAILVHPDKNMGNEKAAEAFKKLQNAYEILLDTLKRKTYDDELRRAELLNYFCRFQSASQKNGSNLHPGSSQFETEDEGAHGESRRIACKKCGQFHLWILTGRPKSRARWCQDCNDFHQAKDGDGWLEQSFHPFLFGLLHKVDPPRAYVCAESRIFDSTAWFVCQGMRCPSNTHKASFHVNTNPSSKRTNSPKGTSSTHRSFGGDEPMTEEGFFEWLQNSMQSDGFDSSVGGTSNESPSSKSGSSSKSSNAKKRRKGKKQW